MPEFAVKLNSKALVVGLGENTVLAGRERMLAQIAANTALAAGNFIDGGKAAAESATSEGDFFSYSDGDGGIVYAVRDAVGSTEIAQAATKAQVDAKVATADLVSPADGKGADIPVYQVPGIGSIVRTVKDKLLEIISVKDKGAVGDGSNASSAFVSAGSGAVIPPGTYALDDNVIGDFYALPGASITGGLRARVYPIGARAGKDASYKKSLYGEIPLLFADYAAAKTDVGNPSFIYPQGFAYDNAGNLFIKYAGGTSDVIVVYNSSLTYQGWFKITAGGESLAIVENGSTRLLYSSAAGNLNEFNITALPANGATVSATARITGDVGPQFAYDKGQWLIEQAGVDIGVIGSRTKWNIYNGSFSQKGVVFIPKTLVGFQLATESDYYSFIPKAQGIALANGNIYIGHGGSYIPATDGATANPVADYGVTEMAMDGRIVRRGVVNANGLINRLVGAGLDVTRTENEGVARHPDGSIHSMLITKRPGDATANSVGIVLFREFDPGGKDYSEIPSTYAPFDLNRYFEIFPQSASGSILDPFKGTAITTMDALLRLMADMQIPRTAYYTSAVTLTEVTGMGSIAVGQMAIIRNVNNSRFLVDFDSVIEGIQHYKVDASGSTWTAALIDQGAVFLSGTGSPEGAVTARPRTYYINLSGTAGAILWVKKTGAGNTGWIAV